jgi:hypothetical protein
VLLLRSMLRLPLLRPATTRLLAALFTRLLVPPAGFEIDADEPAWQVPKTIDRTAAAERRASASSTAAASTAASLCLPPDAAAAALPASSAASGPARFPFVSGLPASASIPVLASLLPPALQGAGAALQHALCSALYTLGRHVTLMTALARSRDASNQLSAVLTVLEATAEAEIRSPLLLPELLLARNGGDAEAPPLSPEVFAPQTPASGASTVSPASAGSPFSAPGASGSAAAACTVAGGGARGSVLAVPAKLTIGLHRRANALVASLLSQTPDLQRLAESDLGSLLPMPPVSFLTVLGPQQPRRRGSNSGSSSRLQRKTASSTSVVAAVAATAGESLNEQAADSRAGADDAAAGLSGGTVVVPLEPCPDLTGAAYSHAQDVTGGLAGSMAGDRFDGNHAEPTAQEQPLSGDTGSSAATEAEPHTGISEADEQTAPGDRAGLTGLSAAREGAAHASGLLPTLAEGASDDTDGAGSRPGTATDAEDEAEADEDRAARLAADAIDARRHKLSARLPLHTGNHTQRAAAQVLALLGPSLPRYGHAGGSGADEYSPPLLYDDAAAFYQVATLLFRARALLASLGRLEQYDMLLAGAREPLSALQAAGYLETVQAPSQPQQHVGPSSQPHAGPALQHRAAPRLRSETATSVVRESITGFHNPLPSPPLHSARSGGAGGGREAKAGPAASSSDSEEAACAAAAAAAAVVSLLSAEPLWDGQVVVSDPLLRELAPPLDSIRPGHAFSIAKLPWFKAAHYPLTLDLPVPPMGLLPQVAEPRRSAADEEAERGRQTRSCGDWGFGGAPPRTAGSATGVAAGVSAGSIGGGSIVGAHASGGEGTGRMPGQWQGGAGGGIRTDGRPAHTPGPSTESSFTDDEDSDVSLESPEAPNGGARSPVAQPPLPDPLAPLVRVTHSGRRLAVVLGQSYLVLAELLLARGPGGAPGAGGAGNASSAMALAAQPGYGPSSAAAAAGGTAIGGGFVVSKGRALAVCPLHLCYSFIPPQAVHVLDVRMSSRDAVPLAQALPASHAGLSALTTSPHAGVKAHVCGFVLVMDEPDVTAHVAMHIDASRRRIIGVKLDAILRLELPPWEPLVAAAEEVHGRTDAGAGAGTAQHAGDRAGRQAE